MSAREVAVCYLLRYVLDFVAPISYSLRAVESIARTLINYFRGKVSRYDFAQLIKANATGLEEPRWYYMYIRSAYGTPRVGCCGSSEIGYVFYPRRVIKLFNLKTYKTIPRGALKVMTRDKYRWLKSETLIASFKSTISSTAIPKKYVWQKAKGVTSRTLRIAKQYWSGKILGPVYVYTCISCVWVVLQIFVDFDEKSVERWVQREFNYRRISVMSLETFVNITVPIQKVTTGKLFRPCWHFDNRRAVVTWRVFRFCRELFWKRTGLRNNCHFFFRL